MGWSNYILLKKHKIALEISRNTNQGDIYEDSYEDIKKRWAEDIDYNFNGKESALMKANALVAFHALLNLDQESFLFCLLKDYYGDVEIVSEHQLQDFKDKKDWKIIAWKRD